MKAVEAKGDLLADGTIRLREKVDVPAGEVYLDPSSRGKR